MERLAVEKTNENNVVEVKNNLTFNYVLVNCANLPASFTIDVEENSNADLLILNPKNNDINLNVNRNAHVKISVLAVGEVSNMNITANLKNNAELQGYLADFITNNAKVNMCANLQEPYSTCNWHLASVASKDDHKEFDVSVYHFAPNTFAKMDNYGVCKDEAKLTFSGISKIEVGAYDSKTHQNAKIMVFDEKSIGIAKPILKIDENSIEASHAAVVGKINDEHLFYLVSRGLSEAEAKELITLGYLKPILKGFQDEDITVQISNLIEERM